MSPDYILVRCLNLFASDITFGCRRRAASEKAIEG